MITYKEDPSLGKKVITTARGDKEYRSNCQSIKGKFYVRNRDCFQFNGKWHRYDSGLIVCDHETGEWLLKQSEKFFTLKEGIVFADSLGNTEKGYYTPNVYNNCLIDVGGSTLTCVSWQMLQDNGYVEDLGSGKWYCKSIYKGSSQLQKFALIRTTQDYTRKGYNIEDNEKEYDEKRFHYDKYPLVLSKDVRQYAKLLGGITFGIEFETSRGNIPDWLQYRHGLVACRDGSLTNNAGEFVTVPMEGAKGLQNIVELSNIFKRRVEIDIHCSMHIHIGNIPLDRSYICALYILGYKIQDDVFKMFPYYKTDPTGIKKKNYCQKLKKMSIHTLKDETKQGYQDYVNTIYSKIFVWLSQGTEGGGGIEPGQQFNRDNGRHPIAQKFSRAGRYFYLNLMNMVFGDRGTAEFRLHGGSVNSQKIINWLFMSNAILKYTEDHQKEIFTKAGKISFVDILNYYAEKYPKNPKAAFLSEYLIAYYKERCEIFKRDLDNGDRISEHDIVGDKDYVFNYSGTTHLF